MVDSRRDSCRSPRRYPETPLARARPAAGDLWASPICDTDSVPSRRLSLDEPLDLGRTLGVLVRGNGDPTIRLRGSEAVRATRTPEGPATFHLTVRGGVVDAEAWGAGADHALARLPQFVGLDDDRSGWEPDRHPLIRDLDRRLRGVRLGRTGSIMEALVPAVLEQKVTGTEAWRGLRGIVRRWGEPAPGPFGLRLLPDPRRLATIPYHELHPLGVERRRADLVRRVCDRAARLDEIVDLPREAGYARLRAIPGIGPWTAAEVMLRATGDPDAVSVGDFHLPNVVAFALAGEIRGDDRRMLELLEPWRGQRARVVRLLELSGIRPPAFGPRYAPRSIAAI
jgi:3-methyladenine DNA glycosylase/8-oxoguanine DNA glycosylase